MFHTQIALEFYTVVDRGSVAVGAAELVARMFGQSGLYSFAAAVFTLQSINDVMKRLTDIVKKSNPLSEHIFFEGARGKTPFWFHPIEGFSRSPNA